MSRPLDETVERLTSLAADIHAFAPSVASRLDRLQSDLTDPEERTRWGIPAARAVLDADSIVSRFEAVSRQRLGGVLSILEWVRNVVVLFPIGLTWYGLSIAADNYARAIQRDPGQVETPFLLLWQRGFSDGAFPWLTFSHLALIDAILILLVVGLSIIVHGFAALRERAIEIQARDLEWRVADARGAVSMALVEAGRSDHLWVANHISDALTRTTSTFEKRTEELLDHLALERRRIVDYSQQRADEVSALSAFSTDLLEGVATFRTEAERVGQAAGSINAAARSLQVQVDGLSRVQQSQVDALTRVEASLTSLARGYQGLESSLHSASERVAEAAVANGDGARFLVSSFASLGQLVSSTDERHASLLEALSNERNERRTMATALDGLSEGMVGARNAIGGFSQGLDQAAAHIVAAAGSLDQIRQQVEVDLVAEVRGRTAFQAQLAELTRTQIELGTRLAAIDGHLAHHSDEIERLTDALRVAAGAWSEVAAAGTERQELNDRLATLAEALTQLASGRPIVLATNGRSKTGRRGRGNLLARLIRRRS